MNPESLKPSYFYQNKKALRFLPISVYRNSPDDFSRGGITAKAKDLMLLHPEGIFSLDDCYEFFPKNPMVTAIYRASINYWHLEPLIMKMPPEKKTEGEASLVGQYVPLSFDRHCMAGGTFAYSHDSRFANITNYPMSVHDRVED